VQKLARRLEALIQPEQVHASTWGCSCLFQGCHHPGPAPCLHLPALRR